MIEIVQLFDETGQYNRASRILDDSREQLLELVNRSDIKGFIFAVWGIKFE